jgi:hypothetical protein
MLYQATTKAWWKGVLELGTKNSHAIFILFSRVKFWLRKSCSQLMHVVRVCVLGCDSLV